MENRKTEVFNPNLKNPTKPKTNNNQEIDKNLIDYASSFINKNTEKNILKSINTKERTQITIDYLKPNLLQKLVRKTTKVFYIKALVMAQSTKIAEILLDLPDIILDEKQDSKDLFDLALINANKENTIKLCNVISIFLVGEIDKKVSNFIYNNLTYTEVLSLVVDIIKNGGFVDFIYTISLIQNNLKLKTAAK